MPGKPMLKSNDYETTMPSKNPVATFIGQNDGL